MKKAEKQFFTDKFTVPKAGVQEFKERINLTMNILSEQIGFVKYEAYENVGEEGNLNYLYIVTWENEEVLEKAKLTAQKEYDKLGLNQDEMIERLHITREITIYTEV